MPKKLFSMSMGPWVFSPRVPSTIAICLILPIVVYLGTWQLQRADEKSKLESQLQRLDETTKVDIQTIANQPFENIRFNTIELIGSFNQSHHFLLDNQLHQKEAGYRLLTPLEISPSLPLLLIDRGWLPKHVIRKNPDILFTLQSSAPQQLQGFVNHPPHGIALGQNLINLTEPTTTLQTLVYEELSQAFGRAFYPFTMQVNQQENSILTYIAPTVPVPATRHLGYALQWFTMAIASMLYYFLINTKRND